MTIPIEQALNILEAHQWRADNFLGRCIQATDNSGWEVRRDDFFEEDMHLTFMKHHVAIGYVPISKVTKFLRFFRKTSLDETNPVYKKFIELWYAAEYADDLAEENQRKVILKAYE